MSKKYKQKPAEKSGLMVLSELREQELKNKNNKTNKHEDNQQGQSKTIN